MTINYYTKNIYGKTLIYIKDEAIWSRIYQLTGKKTIDQKDIEALRFLGVDFKRVFENEI